MPLSSQISWLKGLELGKPANVIDSRNGHLDSSNQGFYQIWTREVLSFSCLSLGRVSCYLGTTLRRNGYRQILEESRPQNKFIFFISPIKGIDTTMPPPVAKELSTKGHEGPPRHYQDTRRKTDLLETDLVFVVNPNFSPGPAIGWEHAFLGKTGP